MHVGGWSVEVVPFGASDLSVGALPRWVVQKKTAYFGADLASISVLALLLGVLLVRPGGLFSGVAARQV